MVFKLFFLNKVHGQIKLPFLLSTVGIFFLCVCVCVCVCVCARAHADAHTLTFDLDEQLQTCFPTDT